MGTRFRKSVKIAPGVRANFGKKSASLSFGTKGARYTVSSTGKKTTTVGIPGTGLSHVSTSGAPKHKGASSSSGAVEYSPKKCKVFGIIFLIIAAVAILVGLLSFSVGGWIFLIFGLSCLLLGLFYLKKGRAPKDTEPQEITAL